MADPLSFAAGVIGVLTAAAQVSSLLAKFTKSTSNAPAQARRVLIEVDSVSGILSHLHSFVIRNEWEDASRTSLLRVDQIVTIISGCVLTFSELEKLMDDLQTDGMSILDRLKWVRKEAEIEALIQRLQHHKASLSLILEVLNG